MIDPFPENHPLPSSSVPKFFTMLLESSKPVLYKFHYFIWTFIGVGVYLFVSLVNIHDLANSLDINLGIVNTQALRNLTIANIDPTVVALTGLSQGGYLAGKFTSRTSVWISSIFVSKSQRSITLFGDNFGDVEGVGQGIVLIDNDKVTGGPENSIIWRDNRITPSPDKYVP